MFNKNTKKGAFLSSLVALILCCSMFVGTTFAWFTDEVTSAGNIIKSGTLDVEMYYGDSATNISKNAADGAIFDYKYWEPGYTQTKYVKIVNNGDLAFKFQLNIIPDEAPAAGDVNLADVIDVYFAEVTDPADFAELDRNLAGLTKVGTLAELMADADGAAHGILLPSAEKRPDRDDTWADVTDPAGEISYCIVLKMQESAGNEYQNLSVGDGFSVQLLANQYTWEEDSFDHTYDEDAEFAPKANVINTGMKTVTVADPDHLNDRAYDSQLLLNTSFQFQPTETYEQALESEYQYYHADYVVSANADIPANSVTLAGFYQAYADYLGADVWIPMSSDSVITEGTQIRLVELLGATVNYEEICKWGNDGTGFLCGIADNSNGALDGVTVTVELRLYETTGDPDTTTGPKNEETGEYITIGTYKYTFGNEVYAATSEQLEAALEDGATDITLVAGEYTMPTTTGDITITGDESTVISGNDCTAENVTFNGVTIESTGKSYTGIKHSNEVVYNDTTIVGNMYLYAEKVVFNNCTFDLSETNDYIWVYGATNVEFNNCTFNTMGKAILVFQDGSKHDQTVKVEGCTFNASAPAYNWDKTIHIAAVSIDGSQGGTYNVILNNNTVDSNFNGLWQDKTSAGNITVTVDGEVELSAN